jgi:lipopolysaccharide heptosyltransferase II
VVFTTPAVRAIRAHFPDAHITYLVEPAAAPVVLNNPHIDRVLVAPRARGFEGLRGDIALGRQLRGERYDLAIDFHGGPRASLLTWLSRARVRLGYEVVGRSWMYTRRVGRPRALRPRHGVLNQWDLLAALDSAIAAPTPESHPVEMPVDPVVAAAMAHRLRQAGAAGEEPVIVMHVSAGNPFRRWPIASFASVASALVAGEPGRTLVVTSGPSERDAAQHVIADARRQLVPNLQLRILDCGEFSLAELRALFDRAALFIGGDSGPMHVAATSEVPIVTLYGPTLPARSAPWRRDESRSEAVETHGLPCRPCEQRVCAPGDFRCLTSIRPEQVIEAAERLLARHGKIRQ